MKAWSHILSFVLCVRVCLGMLVAQQPSITPKSTFHTPTQLADHWADTPIPLSAYTPQELTMQRLLNQQEAAVIAYAPEKEEVFWASSELDLPGQNGIVDALEITPYTWKWVELEMRKADGSELVMRLRRPHQWFWQTGADSLGQTIWIDMPEMGAQGWATVQRIWPQQLDTRLWEEHRQGDYAARPITGRFIHQSEDVWDFYFSHSDSAIGATANHPFWSEDRMAWVEVGELALGERVRLHGGETATLTRKVRRPGWHKVYNLEIWRDHNFHVGEEGVWVHNGCIDDALGNLNTNDWHHILNGSKRKNPSVGYNDHGWRKLFSNPNSENVGRVLRDAYNNGVETVLNPSRGVYKKVYATPQGPTVEVIYRKKPDGSIEVSDGWVRDTQIH